mmetsp:Transcript_34189/g.33389  ORF Transcript_34189/g.33389 Transcript_34189/m.33389 type:complete len:110 (+) Transcript_34189:163-492(+)
MKNIRGRNTYNENLLSNFFIPFGFFLLLRKILGQIVAEKESGMKVYLEMNGCKFFPYYLSYLLSETIFAILIGIITPLLLYSYGDCLFYFGGILKFDLSLLLFVAGSIS